MGHKFSKFLIPMFIITGVLASLVPGVSPVTSAASRSAYYAARAANGMTNLAYKLKRTTAALWRVIMVVRKLSVFATNNLKKLIFTSNSVTIGNFNL